jgi:lysophospholipase L1-like esterase
MNRRRWVDAAAIVLAIAVVVGLGFAMRQEETVQMTVQPSTVSIERPQPAQRDHPSALYIGDSYTFGQGPAEVSYACMAARRLSWFCHLSALPGTGYISGGPANRFLVDPYLGMSTSFIERIPQLATVYEPDVVIFDGGRNDSLAPIEDVFKAMVATIEEAREVWPAAEIVVIRPRFLARPGDDLGYDDEFFERLESTVRGVVVLDPIYTLADTNTAPMVIKDGIHPNRQGELAITAPLARSLAPLRLGVPT